MKIRHGIDTSKRAKKRELEVEYLQNNAEGDFTHILAMPAKLPAEIPVEKPEDESYSFSLELPVEELI